MPTPSDNRNDAQGSRAFECLAPQVQQWIWSKGWNRLREIQEKAIVHLTAGDPISDLLIGASTASGKTEAACLPIASRFASESKPGLRMLCLSPLKALINDQGHRLEDLFSSVDAEVHVWHGDIASNRKRKVFESSSRSSVLLITPESLEALFVRRGPELPRLFESLEFVLVDELHAFLGHERGRQLQSLLHRVERLVGRRLPRIGLSATLGDMILAAEALRPRGGSEVVTIESSGDHDILVQVRTYVSVAMTNSRPAANPSAVEHEPADAAEDAGANHLAGDLFSLYRGGKHLVFANRRADVELLSARLRRLSEESRLPNEFFPHHGNLSKALRDHAENALRRPDKPATVLATTTLELGIDVGEVETVGQVGAPSSVSSMRQRLGRSGRRAGNASVIRVFVRAVEPKADSAPHHRLHPAVVQSIAAVRLLAARWCEPPIVGAAHLSTLVQQVLSVIAERGGVYANEAFDLLCQTGPFRSLSSGGFARLLRDLAAHDLIDQIHTGELVMGIVGEQLTNHYDFYSAFTSSEEYRLVADGKTLGSLPVETAILPKSQITFAGRWWRVIEVDERGKTIVLAPASGGREPSFLGGGALVHDRVREEMRNVLESDDTPAFADASTLEVLAAARAAYLELGLAQRRVLPHGDDSILFPWLGDRAVNTLFCLLTNQGVDCGVDGYVIRASCTASALRRAVQEVLSNPPNATTLARSIENKCTEKHHRFLGEELLADDYASSKLDFEAALAMLSEIEAPS